MLLWINLIEFRLHEATERQLDFIEVQEEEDMIQKNLALSNWSVVIQNTVTETWPLFSTTHQNSIIKAFKSNTIALPVDRSCDPNKISIISTFEQQDIFIMKDKSLEI